MGADEYYSLSASDEEEGPVDTGPWLFVGTMVYSVSLCIGLGALILQKKRRKQKESLLDSIAPPNAKQLKDANQERERITDEDRMAIVSYMIDELLFTDPAVERFLMEFDESQYSLEKPSPLDLGFLRKKVFREREIEDHTNLVEAEGEQRVQSEEEEERERKAEKRKRQRREIRRFWKLAAPLTLSGLYEYLIEIVYLIIISHFLGEDSLNAYIAVQFICEVSVLFAEGLADAQYTLVNHAVGASNGYLAGQYIQLSIFFDFLYYVLLASILMPSMPDILKWFGYSDTVVVEGVRYFNVAFFAVASQSILEKITFLLDIIDKAKFQATLNMARDTTVAIVGVVVLKYFDVCLLAVAWIELVNAIVFAGLTLQLVMSKGWLDPYLRGMTDTVVIFHSKELVVDLMHHTGVLSVGYILSHSEWEVLTLMALYNGAESLSAWLILGTIWGMLEETIEGMGEAVEIRVAYHLGRGDYKMAKSSAYLSIGLGTSIAVICGTLLLFFGRDIISLITPNEEVGKLAYSVLPFVAVGNLVLVYGSLCTNLMEVQGRYRLATFASVIAIFFITLPLAATFTYGCNFGLVSLAAALVVGYSTSGAGLAYLILQSDWKKYSEKIRQRNEAEESSDEEDEDEEDKKTAEVKEAA